MKINRNNKFVATGLAALAVAGLSVGATACLGNGATVAQSDITTETAATTGETSMSDTTQTAIDADDHRSSDEGAGDRREADTDTYTDTSSVTTDLDVLPADESPVTDSPTTPASETPAADTDVVDDSTADVPATDTPATDTPATDAPVEIHSGDSTPSIGGVPTLEILMNPGASVEMVLFFGSSGDLDASLFLKESGFGANDIISVKLVYYAGDTKTTTGATLGRETSSVNSIWKAENLQLSSGDYVSVRITNSKGVTTYTDVLVTITPAM
ncbi:MAG: hypothetical protein ACKOHN_08130 [Actinomycetota bacterium]